MPRVLLVRLDSSSLPPGDTGQQLIPSGAPCGLQGRPLGSAWGGRVFPYSLLPKVSRTLGLLWEMVLYSRLCPLCFPEVLSKWAVPPRIPEGAGG